jgi:uncharacterized protein (TIGR02996 family)
MREMSELDAVDGDGWTRLHHAVVGGDLVEIDRLLAAGASVAASNDRKPGHGHRALTDGGPPLLLAIERGDLAVFERLLAAKARVTTGNGCGLMPLHVAAFRGHVVIAERLLAAKAKLEAKIKVYEGHAGLAADARPLHAAARGGSAAMITLLLDQRAEIDAQDARGETALVYASRHGHDDAVRALLDRGASLEGRHRSILMGAVASSGPGRILALLVERGAQLESLTWLLHLAARNPNDDAVPTLHRLGADLEARDEHGWTALHWAAFGGNAAAAAYMLARGVDPSAATTEKVTRRVVAGRVDGWFEWNLERSVPAGSTAAAIAELAQDVRYAHERSRRLWNAKCQGVARLLLPQAPGAPTGDAVAALLEQAIREEPDRPETYAIYGDWLGERDEPRSELVHVQLALEDGSRPAAIRALLAARETELLERHARAWLGDIAELVDDLKRAVFARGLLRELHLAGTLLGDRSAGALLAHVWLRRLDLARTKISDLALEQIAELPCLETLAVGLTNVTDAAMSSLARMKSLTTLDLTGTSVREVRLGGQRSLASLALGGTLVDDDGLATLGELRALEVVELDHTQITDATLSQLSVLPALTRLNLAATTVTNRGVAAIAGCETLEELNLARTAVTGTGLALLGRLPNLRRLYLGGLATLDDRDVEALGSLQALDVLDVYNVALTSDGLAALRAALPRTRIVHTS